MREIKFRVWNPIDKTMHYEALPDYNGDVKYLEKGKEIILEPWADREPILMQYTGLKDKNGKEVYKGDIVEFRGEIYEITEIANMLNFMLISRNGDSSLNVNDLIFYGWYQEMEVIGNIYENPELLDITNCDDEERKREAEGETEMRAQAEEEAEEEREAEYREGCKQ